MVMSMNHAFKFLQLHLECKLQDASGWRFPAPALFVVPIQKEWLSWEWILCTKKSWYPSIMGLKYESLICPQTPGHLVGLWPLFVSIQLPEITVFQEMLILADRWWNFKWELNTSNMYLVISMQSLSVYQALLIWRVSNFKFCLFLSV